MRKLTTITGEFQRVNISFDNKDSRVVIASIIDSDNCLHIIKGQDNDFSLTRFAEYTFHGYWTEYRGKPQFAFQQFVQRQPNSRFGTIQYLTRNCRNIGNAIAGKLFDLYGSDCCSVLRIDPHRVSEEIAGLTLERARQAAKDLRDCVELEETKIAITNLLAGRGFPVSLTEQVIKKWGILAPERIKKDPLSLLVQGFSGCGFRRCDTLYCDLGLNPARLKRQMLAVWHSIHSDTSGHTWFPVDAAKSLLAGSISGAEVDTTKAIKLGVRSGWLSVKTIDGKSWIAEKQMARNEQMLAESIREMLQ